MGTALIPGTTTRIRVPDGATPEVVQRMVRSYQDFQTRTSGTPDAVPQVPTTADELDPTGSAGIDYRPEDHESWPTYLMNEAGSYVRGAGRALASTPDLLLNAWEKGIVDPWIRLPFGGSPVSPSITEPGGYKQPFLEKFEEVAPAMPLGHQGAQDYGEIYGVPSIANLGKNIVKSSIKKGAVGAAKSLPADAAKAAIRTVPEVGLDQLGGYAGEKTAGLFGPEYELAGSLLGSTLAGAVQPTLGKGATKKALSGPQTDETFFTVDELNRELERGGKPKVPMSLGLGGNKYGGLIEDYLARGPLVGSPSMNARRAQYEGIEGAVQQAAEDVRGGPATQQITERTLGVDTNAMANKADETIKNEISRIQEELQNDVGKGTFVMSGETEKMLQDTIDPNNNIDEEIKDHAQEVLDAYRRNYRQPESGIGPPQPATYGKVTGRRARVGNSISPSGQPLDTGIRKEAYRTMTADMEKTAKDRGVKDWASEQEKTKDLYDQQDIVRTHKDKAGETQAFSAMLGGKKGKNITQLQPYADHTPDELSNVLADAIELRYRGASAGQDIAPEDFKIAKLPGWLENDPKYKEFLTRGNINASSILDNAAFLAKRDTGRSGEFSVPGGSKSAGTAAAITMPGIGAIGGLVGGGANYLAGGGVSPYALAAPPVSALANLLLSKVVSSDEASRNLLRPKPRSIPGVMGDAAKGATVAAGGESSARAEQERRRKEREELEREEKRNRR